MKAVIPLRIGTTLCRVPDGIGFLAGRDAWMDSSALVAEVERMADHGFEHVEIPADLGILGPDLFDERGLNGLRDVAWRRGLTYSIHLHGTCSARFGRYGICLDSLDDGVRAAAVAWIETSIRRFLPLPVRHFVVHAVWGEGMARHIGASSTMSAAGKRGMIGRLADQAEKSLAQLARALPSSRMLCLENLSADFSAAYALAQRLHTSVCLDGGHCVLAAGGEPAPLLDFARRFGSRVSLVHCHGVANGEAHQPLSAAEAEAWGPALESLGSQGFAGPVVLQVPGEEAALASLRVLRAGRQT